MGSRRVHTAGSESVGRCGGAETSVGRGGGSIYPPHNGVVTGWIIRRSTGPAQRFHDLDPDAVTGHEIWIHRVDRPAVIFGSTQVPDRFEGEQRFTGARIEVCRRRSGGGLVIVQPGDVWIDAIVPHLSPLHDDDVGLAFRWLGRVWLDALRPQLTGPGIDGRDLHLAEPPPGRRAAGRPFFCFADAGHGEVLHRDRKVVGISQRRTRHWTRLQSLLVAVWDPEEIDALVDEAFAGAAAHPVDRRALGGPPHVAANVRAGFGPTDPQFGMERDTVVEAFVRSLPDVTQVGRPDRPVISPR